MADNVRQVLESKAKTLLEKLVTNPDLCNVVLAFLSRCIVICAQRGKPIEGIEIPMLETREFDDGDLGLGATVVFHDVGLTPASIWPLQSDFAKYTRSKAHGLGMALQKNPKLCVLFDDLICKIDQYAQHKNIQFGALNVKQSILTKDDRIVLRVGRKLLDA